MCLLLDKVGKLHNTNDITNNIAGLHFPGGIEVTADGSATTENTNIGDDVNELVDGLGK
jgi:hypothetical protein